MNRKNLAAVDELFTTNLADHALPSGLPPGIEDFKQLVSAHVYALPTLQVTIEEMS